MRSNGRTSCRWHWHWCWALVASNLLAPFTYADSEVGDPIAGEEQFIPCGACHTSAANEKHSVGPNLHGLFGRKSASAADFKYSSAMLAANIVWNEDTLDRFLADPQAVVPGTTMSFNGLTDAQARADIIAYLKKVTE